MRIGVIGIGAMGAPIAVALAEDHDVTVFDERPELLASISDRLPTAASAIELVAASDVVITVLPGPVETADVIGKCAADFVPGACWLDLGTGDPRVTRRLSAELAERGVDAVGAPMAGGPSAARARLLHFTAAGTSAAAARVEPVLRWLSAPGGVDVIGEDPAEAQTVKLLSNLLWFGQVVAVTEVMLLGRALGSDPRQLLQWLGSRAGASAMLDRDYDAVLRGDYMASFGLDRVVEQLTTLISLAEDLSVPFALSTHVARVHQAALDAYGPVAGELLAAKFLEEQGGRDLAEK